MLWIVNVEIFGPMFWTGGFWKGSETVDAKQPKLLFPAAPQVYIMGR